MNNLYDIYATDAETGEVLRCFLWQGRPEDGISRAKHEAALFGLEHLREFHAKQRPAAREIVDYPVEGV
jgi:hypothetical protein